jgi:serine/threonine-protein kinase
MQTGALPFERLREALSQSYTIDRELGKGGMATVYLAQDKKHDRVVALKVLHPDLAASLGPDRFLREIRMQHLECDNSIVLLVLREIYGGHATLAQLAIDGIRLRQRFTQPLKW